MLGPATRRGGLAEGRARRAQVDVPHVAPHDEGPDHLDHVLVGQVVPGAPRDVDGDPALQTLVQARGREPGAPGVELEHVAGPAPAARGRCQAMRPGASRRGGARLVGRGAPRGRPRRRVLGGRQHLEGAGRDGRLRGQVASRPALRLAWRQLEPVGGPGVAVGGVPLALGVAVVVLDPCRELAGGRLAGQLSQDRIAAPALLKSHHR